MNFSKRLRTERLVLQPVVLWDIIFFLRLVADVRVRQYLGAPVPLRQGMTQFSAYRQGHPKVGIWAVRRTSKPGAIGLVVLSPHKDGEDYEVSYQFRQKLWGQGFACEATARVVEHALNDLGLPRVIAETQTENAASCKMLESLGFIEEKRLSRFGALQAIYARYEPTAPS